MAYERALLDGATKYGVYVPSPGVRSTLAAGSGAYTVSYARQLLDGATKYGVDVSGRGRQLFKQGVGSSPAVVTPVAGTSSPAAILMGT